MQTGFDPQASEAAGDAVGALRGRARDVVGEQERVVAEDRPARGRPLDHAHTVLAEQDQRPLVESDPLYEVGLDVLLNRSVRAVDDPPADRHPPPVDIDVAEPQRAQRAAAGAAHRGHAEERPELPILLGGQLEKAMHAFRRGRPDVDLRRRRW